MGADDAPPAVNIELRPGEVPAVDRLRFGDVGVGHACAFEIALEAVLQAEPERLWMPLATTRFERAVLVANLGGHHARVRPLVGIGLEEQVVADGHRAILSIRGEARQLGGLRPARHRRTSRCESPIDHIGEPDASRAVPGFVDLEAERRLIRAFGGDWQHHALTAQAFANGLRPRLCHDKPEDVRPVGHALDLAQCSIRPRG